MASKANDGAPAQANGATAQADGGPVGGDVPRAPVPSYEDARDELLATVRKLEDGGLPLEESLALWERGEELATICQSWLDGARERLAGRRPDTGPTS
jgi:exodeoxyribonuclease VII small subunit